MTFKVICRKEIIYKNSTSPLCLLFFQGKRKKAVGLGVSVALKHWDAEAQKVTDDCPDRDNIQFQITAKIKEYEKKIQRLEVMDIPVTFENLFEQNSKRLNCSVGEYLKQTIERLETLGKYGSASKHRSLLSRLSEFRSLNTRFDEIDLAFLRDFELFLRKEGNVNNSIATKFAIFKAAYNKALAEGLFLQKINPFAKYKVGSLWTRTRKRAITKEDIQKLVALEIAPNYRTNYAEFARDIFLFSYYTAGINFTDMATLRYCDIVAGFTTPATRHRNCCPFNSYRTPCGLSRNTARPTTHKKIISSLFSTARNTRQHNRFSTAHTRFCGKSIGS